ncbi:hypothetical protein D3C72_1135370 [compost metagenome]
MRSNYDYALTGQSSAWNRDNQVANLLSQGVILLSTDDVPFSRQSALNILRGGFEFRVLLDIVLCRGQVQDMFTQSRRETQFIRRHGRQWTAV